MKKCLKPEGGILQSSWWKDFLRAAGERIIDLPGEVFGMKKTLPGGFRYLYVPRLPVKFDRFPEVLSSAREEGIHWLRFDLGDEEDLSKLRRVASEQKLSVITSPHNMQPRRVLIIPLPSSAEELLVQMKQKTRYNVRLARRKGVKIGSVVFGQKDFSRRLKEFCELVEQTARRKGVIFHPPKRYERLFSAVPVENLRLFFAEYENEVVAASIVSFYEDTATYLHGASGDRYRQVMAPFLLQYEAMSAAIDRGCKCYDLGGVFPDSNDAGKLGITRFKSGFAPQVEPLEMPGTFDVVFSRSLYAAYRLLRKVNDFF